MTLYLNPTQIRLLNTGQISENALPEIIRRNERKLKNWGSPTNVPKFVEPKLSRISKPWVAPRKRTNQAFAAFRRYVIAVFGNRCMRCGYIDWPAKAKVAPVAGGEVLRMKDAQVLCKSCHKGSTADARTDAQRQLAAVFDGGKANEDAA